MALNAALKQLIDDKIAHATAPQWSLPIADVRAAFRRIWTPAITGAPIPIPRVDDFSIPGRGGPIPVRLYGPRTDRSCRLLLYFHGGGYVKGGIEESDAFCRRLAAATDHIVLSVAYRLAPENVCPAALDDAVDATAWSAMHAEALGGRRGALVVCGESAGGNLAALACLRLRASGAVAIAHQVLLQPVVDFSMSFPSIAMPSTECLVPRDDLAWYYRTYCGDACDPRDPAVSPLFADLAGLPPALIIAAEYDTLRDEAHAYARRLEQAGVPTRHLCVDGMIHGFLQMGGLVDEAQDAIRAIARAVT